MSRKKKSKDKDKSSDPGAAPPPSDPTKNRRGRADDSTSSAGTPVEHRTSTNDPSLGFSEGAKVLEMAGLSISGRLEEVPCDLRTEDFFHLVQIAYQELTHAKPEVQLLFTFEEWKHVHALMLYHRLQQVEFQVTGVKQPARNRTPIPYDVKVFQPIWAALSEIGLVIDNELSVKYWPFARMPKSKDQSDPEDIEQVLDCVQYPWEESWEAATRARAERIRTQSIPPFKTETVAFEANPSMDPADYKTLRDTAVKALADLKYLKKYWDEGSTVFDFSDDPTPRVDVDTTSGAVTHSLEYLEATWGDTTSWSFSKRGAGLTVAPVTDLTSLNAAIAHCVKVAKDAKKEKLTFKPKFEQAVGPTLSVGVSDYDGDPGAYGEWLGSDGLLWTDYSRIVDVLSPVSLFSLSFPKDTTGTYMWLIRRRSDESGFFVKLPKRSISTPIWMTGLLLDMGNLPQSRDCTWYTETDRCNSFLAIRLAYIKAAIKSGAPVERFR